MKDMTEEQMKKKLEEMKEKLEEERCIIWALSVKERQSNHEILEARKELIQGLGDLSGHGTATIRVKMVGEVDPNPLMKACEQRFSGEDVELEHAKLCSKWQEALEDASWHPFKRVVKGEEMKEVVDDEDEKLKNLSQEWGEDVKKAVTTALEELNQFNASGRYTVPLLWNFEQGREATLKEGIALMAQQTKHP